VFHTKQQFINLDVEINRQKKRELDNKQVIIFNLILL